MNKDTTGRFYSENAKIYAAETKAVGPRLDEFMERLPGGAAILELGCGAGGDSAAMIARGFKVTPSDGTPEMVAIASGRLGIPVLLLRFEQIEAVAAYDGVWANASLLHVPRSELRDVLERVRRALRPQGLFFASYKTGGEEGLDSHGRYFNRPDPEWLRETYRAAGWHNTEILEGEGGGYGGEHSRWLSVFAR